MRGFLVRSSPWWVLHPGLDSFFKLGIDMKKTGHQRTTAAGAANRPAASRPSKAVASPPGTLPEAKEVEPRVEHSGGRWTFLTNHSHVLILLSRNPSIVLREVAALVGITERAVQRITSDLEEEGFLERIKVGRQNHYRILADQPLRHPIEAHRTIGDLVGLIDEPH